MKKKTPFLAVVNFPLIALSLDITSFHCKLPKKYCEHSNSCLATVYEIKKKIMPKYNVDNSCVFFAHLPRD